MVRVCCAMLVVLGSALTFAAPDAPPRDARFTIYCALISGPEHVRRAKELRDEMMASSGLSGWYVVHQDNGSILYHGFYRAFNDPADAAESARAKSDRERIDQITDAAGQRPFRQSLFVDINSPDPDAPAEWNLVNAKGAWTVQIAAYRGSPERKQFAVDAVREARAQGIEAYFYHGEAISSVCVGVWGQDAVRSPDDEIRAAPDEDLVISIGSPAQDAVRAIQSSSGNRVRVVEPRSEIVDPTLRATLERFPFHTVNGMEDYLVRRDPATGARQRSRVPSFIVEVPRHEASLLRGDAEPPPGLVDPAKARESRPQEGRGRLRSLGP